MRDESKYTVEILRCLYLSNLRYLFIDLEETWCNSAAGDLYEYDQSSKPAWKKHIQKEGSELDLSLAPLKGCSFHGLNGPTSVSIFLLTKVLDASSYQSDE